MAQVVGGKKLVGERTNYAGDCNRNDEVNYKSRECSGGKFLTSPIYYVNGNPHIGHLYTSIAVDIAKRFEMILGNDVCTSFGVDEHGQKVENAAKSAQQNPQDYVDRSFQPFLDLLSKANVKWDHFIRTTNEKHKETAIYLWNKLKNAGLIYKGNYSGWYAKSDEAFYKEEEVADGISKVTGASVEWISEECFFFKLSTFKESLLEYYLNNPETILPKERYNEVIGMLKNNLPDLAISRSRFTWGIPVGENQVMYVWLDALSNYLTAIGYPKNYQYLDWWRQVTHFIGKDILKFHAIYWPAFLMAAEIPLPKRIIAHGWWQVDGMKMSKSLGNVVDPFKLLDEYGSDSVRYYMFRVTPFGYDGIFSEVELKSIYNSELVNELGNLVQRILTLCWDRFNSTLEGWDRTILDKWDLALESSKQAMKNYNITHYINAIRQAVIETNKYIDEKKPWSNPDQEVLGSLCICIRRLSVLYWPIIPEKCEEIASMIGLNEMKVDQNWNKSMSWPMLKRPQGVFPRK